MIVISCFADTKNMDQMHLEDIVIIMNQGHSFLLVRCVLLKDHAMKSGVH